MHATAIRLYVFFSRQGPARTLHAGADAVGADALRFAGSAPGPSSEALDGPDLARARELLCAELPSLKVSRPG